MGRFTIHEEARIAAPIEAVWERLTDHEGMSDWPGVGSCRLVRDGTPRNGLGAVREIKARGLTLLEEIVVWQPPERFEYTITKGLPVDHRGIVQLARDGDATRVTWNIRMDSRWPSRCHRLRAPAC